MASRLPAVTRLLAAVLLAAAFTSGAFQLDDEDLMFDDEDGTRSEAPVAAPMQDGVLGPLSRPKRQFLPYDSNDYVDYTDGSGSGFPPQIYMVKIHILRPWDSRFSNKGGAAFKEFKNEIMQPMQQVLHRVHRDATLEVDSIREGPSGQCMARLVVSMPDHEDRRENLVRNVRSELAKGRLGQLIVNTDYFEVTDYSGDVDNGDASSRVTGGCAADSIFTCKSGKIICDVQMCDGTEDCPDGDDEDGCGCEAGQFLCDSIRCQDESMKCDGIPDCADGTDEFNCGGDTTTIPGPLTTTSTRLQCLTDSTPQVCDDGVTLACFCDENPQCPNGEDESVANCGSDCPSGKVQCGTEPTCIESRFVCDGFQDCRNNWDEENCSVCPPGEQQCGDELTCVSSARICDGYSDCRNNWDEEQNCPLTCPPNMQMCREGRNCLAPNQICDGTPDCPEGSDEQECLCPEGYFRCFTGGNCINVTYRCDGLVQCPDGSDEEDCPCQVWQWTCRDGGCISQASRCDGTIDCNDKSDEYECPSGGCREGEFKCQSGSCVLEEDRCDGVNQCPDGSDEFGCPTPTCGPLEFTCADGKCVPAERKCDGYQDCADDSDEYSCCSSGQFQCGDGSCVPESARCNNVRDCPDDSDETDCPVCHPDEWRCRDGNCVPAEVRCDGYPQCLDHSDEHNCPVRCKTDEWTCRDGSCLPIEGRCDGYHQCWDSSDEENCPPKCRPDEFTCWDGSCVPDYLRCDGSPHCPDSSDEAECYPSTCTSNQWTCSDGSCIPQEKRCDQRYDCPDYTDEYNCTGCSSQEWTCLDRSCIPLENHCNGRYDCLDRSDEENCIASECRPDEFRCVSDYSCIPKSSQCNGLQECRDGSDEEQCAPRPTCKADEFACADDGTCIPSYLQCDGRPYCRDASDEHNCPSSACRVGEFRCSDGTCIPDHLVCDGQRYCWDGSDEWGCPTCRPDQFRCDDGKCLEQWQKCNTISECSQGEDERSCPCRPEDHLCERDGTCIAGSKVCDGRPDCSDASDELNCPLCGRDEWQCLDGQCIHRSYHCDGRQDCLDNSDESVDCTPPVRPPSTPRPELCNSDQFECRNGQCIARAYKCDGIPDCSDGSDEEERVCTPGQCPDSNQFACTSGECVGLDKRCDGNLDCIDRSDELGCPPIPGISDGDDECSVGEIKCNDGLCIDKSWECDSVPDCFDGADELNCCKTTEFKCGDGSCIPDHFLCDTRFDCTDGSDEHNCECKQDEFHCNSGECVPRTVECDGKPDCRDGSDEGDYCPTPSPCTANEFHCQSGECVSQFVVCDGRGDCFDGSDELQCPDGQPGTGTCSESEFKCRDGSCVDRSAYCDRIPDCRDGSDEDNCTRQCASGEFQCTDRQCIRQESVCNRVRDCYDGSDEVNCPTLPPPPPPPTETTTTTYCRGDQFQCGSGDCIPQFYVCDGPRDCRDGSDEDSCTTTSGFTTSTTTTPPPQNTFQCQDGRIINRQQRCDGRRDCSDGSDEIDCPVSGRIDLKTFPDEQTSKQTQEVVFQCRDEGTTRAPVRWERDRGRPLPEGSTDIRGRLTMPRVQMEHEGVYYCVAQGVSPNTPGMRKPVYLRVEPYEVITASPPVVCSLLEATCRSGECINKTQVCDGRPDCKDSSDEDRCGRCEPNEFQCDNRKCVLKTWLCDSDNDCGDNSDEQYCGISDPDAFCHNNEFMCRSGSQCIPKSFHCDGDNDCMDLSDEDGCRKPEVKEPPPRNVMVWVGETFNITCRVEGVPTPIVLWRLNWGHVPAKCQMTSKNGFGMLVCPDAQPTDQGAYSCEAINGKGSVFATPDAIVVVKGIPINQCQPPSFNSLAISQEDCLSCFCFGITNDCFSTDMFITQLPPPNGDSFTLVGANQDQTQGNYVVRDNDYPLSSRHLAYNLPGTQYSDRVVLNVDRSKLRGPGDLAVYFSLPDSHKRQQLASFGGYLRYRITYSHFGASQTTSHPDVIIRGNGLTLMHVHDGTFQENIENWVDVRFFYGHWFKRVVQWGGRIKVEQPASREDIMMVLENMDLLLIRAQYTDGDFINTTLSNVQMDTAEISRNDQGQAGLVEKCVCPPGYTGISCQDCAPNYTRVKEGPWLGRCVYDLVCGPNEYGDPANGISCQPCPCPLGSPSNQFSSSCYLDGDGQVTCNCQQGYSGRRCQYCASGYEGNPTVPGDYCKPAPVTCMTTFTCLDGSQHPWSRRCDGIKDCSQYEDESDCDVCFNSGHRCDDRRCVHFERICDGHPDCHDASDERPENCLDELPCDHIHQWTCADPSHQCIDRSRHCDGFYDCPDNSDERYCNCTCDSAFNFRCNDGTCLDVSVRCNGRVDCKDKSDEHLCPCDPQRYHTCGDGTCIDLYRVCDGNPDCRDRSDEPRWCGCNPNTMHRCGDGTCIEKSAVCDGRPNCRDFSDEPPTCWQNCDQTLEFTCATGNCIDIRLVCNGYTDCQDGSDEHYCIVCAENQFQCGDHSCVDRQRLCDGRPDCRDQSDEGERAGCCVAPYFFRCHDGYCIESQHVCNGYWDCGDGSDERFCSGRCDPAGSIEADPVYGNCQCKEFVTGPQCDQCKEDAFYLSERNKEGCIPCFCMGITSSCSSSNLHRQQEYTYFTNDRQGFEIVDGNLQNFIRDDLFVDSNRQELVFRDFTRYGQKVYYWKLPQRFLGDKVTSYGGNLTYTLRFVPAPGGQSSTNSAYDVEIFGNDILLRHFKQGQSSLSPARQETISVPLYEQYWQRQNGQEVNREHLMMALADLEYIYIKATYTTATEEVGLKDVTLDYAEARNTGQERAYAVEMCDCPREYQGTSCEDCAIGYTRSTSGVHLGTCVPCDCSGHSTECDPDTGVCFNCKNNTAGNHCELCAPGYTLYGDTCYHTDSGSECICDPRGNLSCEGNRCQCKAHVIGTQCESCRPGYYHLSADNPVGCLPCWCSGVTSQCFSSNYYRMQIPMQLLFDHGFTFSNRLQTDVIKEGLDINLANNEISFSNFNNLRNREPYYWSLPQMFTGNRLESYGGSLTVTQKFQIQPGAGIYLEADVIIRSTSGREFFWMRPRHLQQNIPDREQTYTVLLTEDSFTMNQQPASRSEFLKALSSIEAILIRATLSEQMVATFLSDVIMDTAVPTQTGQPRAVEVEQCQCPMEYSGLSCETCKAGYYRKESTNQCLQCPCNGHESYCAERPDGSVQCECLPGYYGPSCAESDPPTPGEDGPTIEVIVSEPSIKVVTVNSTVQLACSARAVTGVQTRIPVTWSKVGGELPYGRARDNRQGLLVITEVRSSDSGVYICAAVDSYGRVVTDNVTLTVSRGRPNVIVEPKQGRFDINLRGSLEVRCSVEGNPEAQVTWTFGPNRPLPPNVYQQSGVLTFRDAQLSDRGEYYCTSTNAYGQGITRVYINVVTSPPGEIIIIEVSEENVVAQAGETVRVRCSASNIPGALNIEWSRLAGSLPQQSVVEQGELQIPSAQPADSGTYVCRITDLRTSVYNEASTRITITQYTSLPTVQIQPDRQTINQGTNAELLCRVSGDPSPVVTWNKAYESQSSRVSVENNILRITNAQVSDRGMYVCTAKNEGGTAQAAAIIEVERREPPQIEMHPQMKQTVVVGGSALFQCNLIAGIPAPTVKWTRTDGQPFSSNTEVLIGGVLRFNQVRGDEEGSYICTAENDVGSVTSMALLEVQSLPIINIRPGPSPYIVRTGDTVRLECFAEGDPPPSVSWKKLQVNYPTPGHSVSGRSGVTEYTITSVSKADEGIYLCSAENSAGTTDERLQLLVEDVLPGTLRPAVPPPGTGVSTGGGGVVYIPAGSPYEFMCSGEGPESDQLEFSFRRSDNRPLPQGSRTHQGTLYLTVVDESASGEYACVGRDRVSGSILFTIYTTIEVLVPPRVSLEPARQVVRPGEVVRIRCSATGLQPITIEWSKDQGRMPASVIINGGELTFRGIATTDAGRYICVARNSGGITRAVAEVLVNAYKGSQSTFSGITEGLYFDDLEDGDVDEDDSSSTPDEGYFLQVEEIMCKFICHNRSICISPLEMCDGKPDCPDGEDEEGCYFDSLIPIDIFDNSKCSDFFKCGDGSCYYFYLNCNGECDCNDCKDEKICLRRRREMSHEEPLLTATDPQVTLYVGQTGELRCETSGINPNDVRWSRVNGRLPPSAVTRGNILRLPLIEIQDSGNYQCEVVTPSGMRLYDIVTLIVRRPQTSNIQIRSIPSVVHRGENVELICEVENEPAAAISWRRVDGDLPYGAESYGNILRIPSVQGGGIYMCSATTRQGIFDERFGLVIREDHVEGMTHRLRSGNTESQSVALGLSVTMECHLSLPGPVSYTWAKRDGKLPANARTDNAILDISKVQAEDAGYYVCTSWNLEKSADLSILLIVTDVVPRFNKSSYLALPTLSRAYTMFDIEITFKPESPDGLILYNSQRAGPDEGDFVAFGLTGGYPEFRFNIGAGPAIIRGTQPLEMNQWHTVKLSRNRKEGRMMVNGGDPVVGVSEGRFRGLDLVEPLFLGGVPDFQNVHRQTGMTSGFKGCISRLVTGNTLNTGFVMNAVKLVGITSCETCATDPCHNSGVCQEAYNERGHKCFCPAGYLGELCENAGESCYEGACGTGRCINKPGGFECYCPFGKIGERCSQDISIYEPAFGDESYIAFPTPLARQTFAVDMNVKPESLDDGLLMYCAQTESGSGDFTSLAIRNKRLEFRFNSGSGTANIQSEPITEGEWIKVRVNRTDKLGSLKLNDGPMVNGESPGSNLGLNLLTPLFIGGVDNSRIHVSSDVGVKTGFRGCVSEIRVMDQEAPLNEAVVDSANVDQCGGGVSPCSRSPCQNNGACVEDPSSIHGYTCHCINEYSGDNCEHEPGVCSMVQPCRNGGACIHQGHRYTCLCPLGFTGGHCERVVQNIGGSAAFSGSSWVELNRTLLPQESDIPQVISFEFRARRPNGLLFWYGQDSTVRGKGQDYISIAIKDGYVEFSYELGGGPAIIRSQSRVDDSQFHSLEVERTGQQGVFTLDRETPQVTHSPGDLHMLNANGNIYIGGAPDIPYMTGGIHTSGFIGCIQKLSIGGHTIDNFLTLPLSGVNVIPCPRQRGGRRKGPQRG